MTEKDLRRRDAKRNIGEGLLRAVQEMKAGKAARVDRIPVSAITEERYWTGQGWNSCVASVMRWSGKKATASCRVRRLSETICAASVATATATAAFLPH